MQRKHVLGFTQNNALERLEWRHTLRCDNTSAASASKCCVSEARKMNDGKVRIADLGANRSE